MQDLRPLRVASAILSAALLAACATTPSDQPEPAALSERTMRDVTRELSLDSYEGREPGTPGEAKTIAYLAQQFAAAGLRPGNNGSWYQDVPLVEITGHDFAPLSVTAPDGSSESFAFGSDWVGVTYRETQTVAIDAAELVFVGFGIEAPEKGWSDYKGVDMAGKIAVILVNDPDYAMEDLDGPFNGRAMTYYGRWTYKFEEAARQGASGALIVHDSFPAAYGWNVVESSWSGPQAYARRADGGANQTAMNGWIQKAAAERIFARAGQDFTALAMAAGSAEFRPVSLGLKATTSFANTIRNFDSHDVVGILPGTARPDEFVLHTAHWDHLGRCKPDASGDDICNGAIDNATGTAGLVTLAKAHAARGATERSLVFLAVTAEESGLLGAQYYASNPVFPLSQTVGGVNMDALYVMGPARDVTVIGGGKSALDTVLAAALSEVGRTATSDPHPEAGYYYRSDHFAFAKMGVPMLYVKPGEDLIDGGRAGGEAWAARYRAEAYHGPNDEFDPAWDWTGVMADLRLYFLLGEKLGNGKDWPNWIEGDEFRRIRDASCAVGEGC